MNEVPDALRTALADSYDVQNVVGRGGMATVYLARDIKHNRQVAVKVLRPELVATLGVDRFLREIEISAQLNHPHILPLLDSGSVEEQPSAFLYYVMPYVDGESLRELLNRDRPLALEHALSIVKEVADALSYAHRKGVVHRDIKPENILLSEGHAVVADFGIARAISTAGGQALTRTGFPLGTPGYMSPEQAAGNTDLDERTDVFSLACVVYELLVGETPGLWPTEEEVRLGRFSDILPEHRTRLDTLPGAVEQALTRAMAQRPRQRIETPVAFVEALEQLKNTRKQYGSAEARDIIQRAADKQASAPTESDVLSLGGIQQIAAEVGIPPEQVRDAADVASDVSVAEPTRSLLGLSTRVDLGRLVDNELPETGYEAVLEEIRAVMGEVGRINPTLGKSLSWNSLSFQNSLEGSGRLTQVMVSPKDGKTRIRITESAGVHALLAGGGVFAATMGTLFLLEGTTLNVPVVIALTSLGAACCAYGFTARALLRRFKARRKQVLSDLLDRISRHVGDTDKQLGVGSTNPGE